MHHRCASEYFYHRQSSSTKSWASSQGTHSNKGCSVRSPTDVQRGESYAVSLIRPPGTAPLRLSRAPKCPKFHLCWLQMTRHCKEFFLPGIATSALFQTRKRGPWTNLNYAGTNFGAKQSLAGKRCGAFFILFLAGIVCPTLYQTLGRDGHCGVYSPTLRSWLLQFANLKMALIEIDGLPN